MPLAILMADTFGGPTTDFATLPFVRQFRIADPVWFDAQPWPHLHHWLQTFLASGQFASVMKKYAV